jgi:hypothetical protein
VKTFDTFKFSGWLVSMLLFNLTWILNGIALFFAHSSLTSGGIDLNAINLAQYIMIYCQAWLIGFLILFVPAGMGVRELALSQLLITFMNLPGFEANIVAVISRSLTLFSELFLILIGFVFRLQNGENKL